MKNRVNENEEELFTIERHSQHKEQTTEHKTEATPSEFSDESHDTSLPRACTTPKRGKHFPGESCTQEIATLQAIRTEKEINPKASNQPFESRELQTDEHSSLQGKHMITFDVNDLLFLF